MVPKVIIVQTCIDNHYTYHFPESFRNYSPPLGLGVLALNHSTDIYKKKHNE
jgi:hypothetical protein